jgi:type VI protein secretion system component Hcp
MITRSWLRHPLAFQTLTHSERSPSAPRNRKPKRRKSLALEVLEDRTLLAGSPSATLELFASRSSSSAVTLALDSYQFGFQNTASVTSGTAGTVTFDDLVVKAPLSGASPQMFQALASGTAYETALLTQRDGSGNPIAEWALKSVFVTSDTVSSDSAGTPTEELHFAFGALTEGTVPPGGAPVTGSWNQVTNSNGLSDVPTLPGDLVDPAAPTGPTASLALVPASGSGLSKVGFAVDSYQFNFQNTVSLGASSAGAGAGKAKFSDLVVTAPFGADSPALFEALASGSGYDSALLTQRDGSGHAIDEWALKLVFVTSDTISNDSVGTGTTNPTEELHFAFGAVTEGTVPPGGGPVTGSWNQVTNSNDSSVISTLPGDLVDPPAPTGPTASLALVPASGSGLSKVVFAVDSYQFGFQNTTSLGSGTAGKVRFDDLVVSAPFGGDSPQLFQALASGTAYETALLTQRDGSGNAIDEWALKLVFVTSDTISNDSAGTGTTTPTEELHFAFGALTEGTTAPGGTPVTQSWSQVNNSSVSGDIPTLPGDLVVPARPASPTALLALVPASGSGLSALAVAIDSYQFSFRNTASLGSSSTGLAAGKVTFDDLVVTVPFGADSPQLFQALASGTAYDTALLTQLDGSGSALAAWALKLVFITSDTISNNSAGTGTTTPTEELHFAFGALTEGTAAASGAPGTASWSQVTNSNNLRDIPALPAGLSLTALPGFTPTVSVTDNGGTYNGSAFPAKATLTGVHSTPVSTLESVAPTFTYYSGTYTSVASLTGVTALLSAPVSAGSYTVLASFAGSFDYTSASALASFTINQATPNISWNPAPIAFFTTLTATQLNATASWTVGGNVATVAGTFTYTPPAGTLLTPGPHTLTATFTPSDTIDYTAATSSAPIVVLAAGVVAIGQQLYCVAGSSTSNDQVTIDPRGSSSTGSTGVTVHAVINGVTTTTPYDQAFTSINILLLGGNDSVSMAGTLTINAVVTAGDGNDHIRLGQGNNTVMLGDGNDTVTAGDGASNITVGNGNDSIQLGNGNNVVTAGTGNDDVQAGSGTNAVTAGLAGSKGNIQVQLGDGTTNLVSLLGNGNDEVHLGNGTGDSVSITGNGNDQVHLGNGAGDSVSITGNGNDRVHLGDGTDDSVSITGDGNDQVETGTGSGTVHVAGTGHKAVQLGSKGWTQM